MRRPPLTRIFLKYYPEALHLKINMVNNWLEFANALAGQLGSQYVAAFKEKLRGLKLDKPGGAVLDYTGNDCSRLLDNRESWLSVVCKHPLHPVIARALQLVDYMLAAITLPAEKVTQDIVDVAYKVAAEYAQLFIDGRMAPYKSDLLEGQGTAPTYSYRTYDHMVTDHLADHFQHMVDYPDEAHTLVDHSTTCWEVRLVHPTY